MLAILDPLSIVALALNFVALGTSRIRGVINAVALQGILLGICPLLVNVETGLRGVLLVGVMIVLKGIVIPSLLVYAMREANIQHEVQPVVNFTSSLLLGAAGTVLALVFSSTLPLAERHTDTLLVPAYLATVGTGFLLLIARRKAITFEREIAEQFGVCPEGHPWFKPVRFHGSYRPGHDAWGRSSDNPPAIGVMDYYRVEGEEVHEVAVGPVHAGIIEPGHFRFQCHGEQVFHLEISLGYQHRTLGLVGPAARACGLERDVRLDFPSGIFRFAHIPLSTWQTGDVFARAFVRWLEIQRSAAFLREQWSTLPGGPIRVEIGTCQTDSLAVALVEGWRGEICHVALTNAQGCFARYKIVDPSFHNWMGLAMALRGQQISDFPLCNKSFNLSYCGHDL